MLLGRCSIRASLASSERIFRSRAGSLIDCERRLNKENISSRAYIAFKNEEQLASFSQGYDGHLFRDKAGVFTWPSLIQFLSLFVWLTQAMNR